MERVHQTIDNIMHTFEIQEMDLEDIHPWNGIISSIVFTTRYVIHDTTQDTWTQLVFGKETILNINHVLNL